MAHFVTEDILTVWHEELDKIFGSSCNTIEREYTYVNKPLPFTAIHMGKKNDEYFLDRNHNKISINDLLDNLNLLIISDFRSDEDLSSKDDQKRKAQSRADLYILHETAEIVIELEIFRDKPFSNLIYIPELCNGRNGRILHFIHCFAPKRTDKEAELTQRIGKWLMQHHQINQFKYESHQMPKPPESINYLLPNKRAKKPKEYHTVNDSLVLRQYARDCYNSLVKPSISKLLSGMPTT